MNAILISAGMIHYMEFPMGHEQTDVVRDCSTLLSSPDRRSDTGTHDLQSFRSLKSSDLYV